MTRNPKPDELPKSIDELNGSARPLIVDKHLSRKAIISRIGDAVDVDVSGRMFDHREMARLTAAVDPDERRDPRTIARETEKRGLIERIGRVYGFDTRDDQEKFIKSQLIHLYIAVATGDTPDTFQVPSDPDEPKPHSDVPVLGDS